MMRRSAVRRVAAILLTATLAIGIPSAVLGHAELKTATPPAGSVQASPVTEVSGVYSEAMQKDGSSIELLDATGGSLAKGGLDPADDTRMVIDLDAPLTPGAYTVKWTSLSTDGDVERGEWSFTVTAAASASPAPATTSSTGTPAASAGPAATPSPSAAPSPSGTDSGAGGGGSDVLLPIVVALIVLGAGAAYLLRQRGRPADRA